MTNTELRPCPFCYGEPELQTDKDCAYFYCNNCGCRVTEDETESGAIRRWNDRENDSQQELVNELTELLGAVTQGYGAEEIYHHYGIDSTRAERIIELINNKGGE